MTPLYNPEKHIIHTQQFSTELEQNPLRSQGLIHVKFPHHLKLKNKRIHYSNTKIILNVSAMDFKRL